MEMKEILMMNVRSKDFYTHMVYQLINLKVLNGIYTAITRAKRCCWCVVCDIEAFSIAAVKSPPFRCENLARRLSERLPNLKPFRINPPIPALEMIGDMPTMPDDMPADVYDTGF